MHNLLLMQVLEPMEYLPCVVLNLLTKKLVLVVQGLQRAHDDILQENVQGVTRLNHPQCIVCTCQ